MPGARRGNIDVVDIARPKRLQKLIEIKVVRYTIAGSARPPLLPVESQGRGQDEFHWAGTAAPFPHLDTWIDAVGLHFEQRYGAEPLREAPCNLAEPQYAARGSRAVFYEVDEVVLDIAVC